MKRRGAVCAAGGRKPAVLTLPQLLGKDGRELLGL